MKKGEKLVEYEVTRYGILKMDGMASFGTVWMA